MLHIGIYFIHFPEQKGTESEKSGKIGERHKRGKHVDGGLQGCYTENCPD
jgi:hypothetical protein